MWLGAKLSWGEQSSLAGMGCAVPSWTGLHLILCVLISASSAPVPWSLGKDPRACFTWRWRRKTCCNESQSPSGKLRPISASCCKRIPPGAITWVCDHAWVFFHTKTCNFTKCFLLFNTLFCLSCFIFKAVCLTRQILTQWSIYLKKQIHKSLWCYSNLSFQLLARHWFCDLFFLINQTII